MSLRVDKLTRKQVKSVQVNELLVRETNIKRWKIYW